MFVQNDMKFIISECYHTAKLVMLTASAETSTYLDTYAKKCKTKRYRYFGLSTLGIADLLESINVILPPLDIILVAGATYFVLYHQDILMNATFDLRFHKPWS